MAAAGVKRLGTNQARRRRPFAQSNYLPLNMPLFATRTCITRQLIAEQFQVVAIRQTTVG